jgi:purine-binding chemotaxis protein CheW
MTVNDSSNSNSQVWNDLRAQLAALEAASRDRLSQRDSLAEKLHRRTQLYRERNESPAVKGPVTSILLFSTRKEKYGLSLDSIDEIQPLETFSFVPNGPDFIHGVVHFRGNILALLNLPRLFGIPETGVSDVHYFIAAHACGHDVAIAAGSVDELRTVPLSGIQPVPDWGGAAPASWVRGIYEKDHLILDLDAILKDESVSSWRG